MSNLDSLLTKHFYCMEGAADLKQASFASAVSEEEFSKEA